MVKLGVPIRISCMLCAALLLARCKTDRIGTLALQRAMVGDVELAMDDVVEGLPTDRSITLAFSGPVNTESANTAITLRHDGGQTAISLGFLADGSMVVVHPTGTLLSNTLYTLAISDQLQGGDGSRGQAYNIRFKTVMEDLQVTAIEVHGEDVN